MKKTYKLSKKLLIVFGILVALGLLELAVIASKIAEREPSPSQSTQVNSGAQAVNNQQISQQPFNKSQHSVNEADSLWVVVDKGRILPRDYVPANLVVPKVSLRDSASSSNMHLRADAAQALEALFAEANATNLKLRLVSGYRSYATQSSVYNGYVRSDGQASADAYSARPGHSEHQTGLAADVAPQSLKCSLDPCFGNTPEGKWLAQNAYRHGFVISYREGMQAVTGYEHEPWHIRYVGNDLAAELKKTNQTLEQFFGLTTYSAYPAQIYKLK